MLVISHPPKAPALKAIHAVTGSLAFTAAARLVFVVVEEPDTDRRLLLPSKSNLDRMAAGLGFTLEQATTNGGIVSSRVAWSSAPVTVTANQALHASATEDTKGASIFVAEEFLQTTLANGPLPSLSVEKEADNLGISKATLKRARKNLAVVAERDGYQGAWAMRLPTDKEPK